MDTQQYKRTMTQPLTPQVSNPDIAALSTIGMRIRKAVAEGYHTNSVGSYEPHYFQSYQSIDQPQSQQFARVPLPGNMSQPPALTSDGSTFQSGSNVSSWGLSPSDPVMLPSGAQKKRSFDDEDEGMHKPMPAVTIAQPSYEEFLAGNNQLRFDEDF